MIIEEIETRQQFKKYWIAVIILVSLMSITWIFINLNSNKNKKFTTKEAEAASVELKNIFYTEVFENLVQREILSAVNLNTNKEYAEQQVVEVGEIYVFNPEPEEEIVASPSAEIEVDNNLNFNNNDIEASESASF